MNKDPRDLNFCTYVHGHSLHHKNNESTTSWHCHNTKKLIPNLPSNHVSCPQSIAADYIRNITDLLLQGTAVVQKHGSQAQMVRIFALGHSKFTIISYIIPVTPASTTKVILASQCKHTVPKYRSSEFLHWITPDSLSNHIQCPWPQITPEINPHKNHINSRGCNTVSFWCNLWIWFCVMESVAMNMDSELEVTQHQNPEDS